VAIENNRRMNLQKQAKPLNEKKSSFESSKTSKTAQ
jgi:hypothetical protein